MGKIHAIKIHAADGTFRRLSTFDQAGEIGEDERVELEYMYDSRLLPADDQCISGMWRYLPLLPIQDDILYPLTVGGTPLVSPPRLKTWTGLQELWLKDETRSPTGSNKDRATALVLEQALHRNVRIVSCASTGNVALSLAVGANVCALEAVIFVPADVSETKLRLMQLGKVTVFKVRAGYEAAVQLSRSAARTFGWYDRNTGYNPLTIEAKKTVAFEIWEQLGRRIPDVVVVPVGDGVTLNGIAKGFRELQLCSATKKQPRIIGVQAEQCQPLKRAWEGGPALTNESGLTVADGIAVKAPINAILALRDVKECGGCFVSVSDEMILEAVNVLAARGGILAEPAGAAALIGAKQARQEGLIGESECVVVLVTGSGLKSPQYLWSQQRRSTYEISGTIDEVRTIREQCVS